MEIIYIDEIAVLRGEGILLKDTYSALDLIGEIAFGAQCSKLVVNKKNIDGQFFKLSTGLLGDILQKFVTYNAKLAIFGDFSVYTSKPLKDFIYESNKGGHIYFVPDEQTAIDKLKGAE